MAQRKLPLLVFLPVALSVLALCQSAPAKPTAKPRLQISEQGSTFCETVATMLNVCPDPYPSEELDLQKFQGVWYTIGSNGQSFFDIFDQKGAQCVKTEIGGPENVNGRRGIRLTKKGVLFGNPLRMVETIVISQNSASAGMGVKYLCQFLQGQQTMNELVPELAPVTRVSEKLAPLSDLEKKFSDQWTKAVNAATNNQGTVTGIVNKFITPVVQNAVKKAINVKPTAENPITLASVQIVGSAASTAATVLGKPVTVKGMSNLIIGLTDGLQKMPAKARGRLGTHAYTAIAGVAGISMFSQQVYTALERIQRNNVALSGGNWPNKGAVYTYMSSIYNDTMRIQWLTGRMHAERRKILKAGYRIFLRLNGTADVDPTLVQYSQAIIQMAEDKRPLMMAINHIYKAVEDMKKTVTALGPGIQLARKTNSAGIAVESPGQPGNFTLNMNGRDSPWRVVQLIGPATRGYDVALVWGCKRGVETGFLPENEFYILSRTPTVPRRVIKFAMQFLRDNGIILAGHNVMLYMTQDAARCNPSFTIP